jgi:hypothetical protein
VRLLFDQGNPWSHCVATYPTIRLKPLTRRVGVNLKNGDLLSAAEAQGFDALITTDQNLRYQQNLKGRKISIVVLLTTNWPRIKTQVDLVVEAIDKVGTGSYTEIRIT